MKQKKIMMILILVSLLFISCANTFGPILNSPPEWIRGTWIYEKDKKTIIEWEFLADNVKCEHAGITLDFNKLAKASEEGITIDKIDENNFDFSLEAKGQEKGFYQFQKKSASTLMYTVTHGGSANKKYTLNKK